MDDEEAFALAPARPADATSAAAAFSAADVAAAATAAVLTAHGATAEALAEKLIVGNSDDKQAEMWDGVATVHRLNEHFAACSSFESAEAFAGTLATKHPKLGAVLVDLLSNCDALVELVVQLMHSLCLHAEGAAMLVSFYPDKDVQTELNPVHPHSTHLNTRFARASCGAPTSTPATATSCRC